MVDNVSDWKRKWANKGDEAKPVFIKTEVWNGLVNYWSSAEAAIIAAKCSASRLSNPDGHGPHKHTSGPLSYAERRLAMAKDGALPPIKDVFAATHKRKDGTFVDTRSETLFKEVEQLEQTQQQSSCGSTELSTKDKDIIFEEVAPKKRGKTVGLGSIRDVPISIAASTSSEDVGLKVELAEAKQTIQFLVSSQTSLKDDVAEYKFQCDRMKSVLEILAATDLPVIATSLRNELQNIGFRGPAPQTTPINPVFADCLNPPPNKTPTPTPNHTPNTSPNTTPEPTPDQTPATNNSGDGIIDDHVSASF